MFNIIYNWFLGLFEGVGEELVSLPFPSFQNGGLVFTEVSLATLGRAFSAVGTLIFMAVLVVVAWSLVKWIFKFVMSAFTLR